MKDLSQFDLDIATKHANVIIAHELNRPEDDDYDRFREYWAATDWEGLYEALTLEERDEVFEQYGYYFIDLLEIAYQVAQEQ